MTDGRTDVPDQATPEPPSTEFPKESEGMGLIGRRGIIIDLGEGVDDSSTPLAPKYTPTWHELTARARFYFEQQNETSYRWALFSQGGGGTRMWCSSGERVVTVREILGDQAFENALIPLEEEWGGKCNEVEPDLAFCEECGKAWFPGGCADDDQDG